MLPHECSARPCERFFNPSGSIRPHGLFSAQTLMLVLSLFFSFTLRRSFAARLSLNLRLNNHSFERRGFIYLEFIQRKQSITGNF